MHFSCLIDPEKRCSCAHSTLLLWTCDVSQEIPLTAINVTRTFVKKAASKSAKKSLYKTNTYIRIFISFLGFYYNDVTQMAHITRKILYFHLLVNLFRKRKIMWRAFLLNCMLSGIEQYKRNKVYIKIMVELVFNFAPRNDKFSKRHGRSYGGSKIHCAHPKNKELNCRDAKGTMFTLQ